MVAPPLLWQFLGVVNKVGGYTTHTHSPLIGPSLAGSGRPLGQPALQPPPSPPHPTPTAEDGAGCAHTQLAATPDEIGLRPLPWMW